MEKMNKVNVTQEKWDYLIILDACSYDYFERVYQNYLQGKLLKKISVGSSTAQWRNNSFPDRYDDTVYISANPNISSVLPVHGFLASEHFHKVYEVWKDGWDKDKGTVLPETLTKTAIEIIKNTNNKKFIIHYLQPHEPYLMSGIDSHGYNKADINSDRILIGSEKYERFSTIKKILLKHLRKYFKHNKILTNQPEWILRQYLQMAPRSAMDAVRRKYGKKMLAKAYQTNLECVLKQVVVLVKHLSGRIVITSDHGELLGEHRCYAHPAESTNPILIEIPWLVMEKTIDIEITKKDHGKERLSYEEKCHSEQRGGKADEKEITEKLRDLGYFDQ